ncbi:hypothetical protein VNO77_33956 [Canavalia gladiata]|uniref:Uncharacterized protein n=1 Tax=Canavalia gladiata TaxID=3824 RepID=A0AAN9PWV3_CANGL
MEETSPNKEEEVPQRKATFYFYHPCYFLEEALKPLFKCLGFESNTKEHNSSMVKLSSDSEEEENNASNNSHKIYQQVPSNEEESSHQECSTSQSFELTTSFIIRPFSRRSSLSKGSDPQTS